MFVLLYALGHSIITVCQDSYEARTTCMAFFPGQLVLLG